MEYHITKKTAKKINPEYIFKTDTLSNHLDECISIIPPLLDALPNFKHIYKATNITDYYGRLKRLYETKRCEWYNRGSLWKN